MKNVFKSKLFVITMPLVNMVLFIVAGILMSYEPYVRGYNLVGTSYLFSMKNAVGIWLIGLAVSLLVFLVCVLIRKMSIGSADDNKS